MKIGNFIRRISGIVICVGFLFSLSQCEAEDEEIAKKQIHAYSKEAAKHYKTEYILITFRPSGI